jgi:hypothetical protein
VLGGCAQVLEELLLANEEEEGNLLTSKSVLTIGESLLPYEAEVKKPMMEHCPDDLKDFDVLEDLDTTCCLEEVVLYRDLKECGGCLL